MTTPDLCTRLDVTLGPDPRRVIVKHVRVPGYGVGASGYNTAVPSKNLDGGRIKQTRGSP